jgi:hypothetical protein
MAGTVEQVPFRGFQRQREQMTKGQVILRILRILWETKNEDEDDNDNEDEDDNEDCLGFRV